MKSATTNLCLTAILISVLVSDYSHAQDKLTVAIPHWLIPDPGVTDVTDSFAKDLASKVGGVSIKTKITTDSLEQLGQRLVTGRGFQIAVVWGIEFGWLREKYPQIEVLAVSQGAGGQGGMTSEIVVRSALLKNDRTSPLGQFSVDRPFRLAGHPHESMVTRAHFFELKRKYQGAIQSPRTQYPSITAALQAIQAGEEDGFLIDQYRWYAYHEGNENKLSDFAAYSDWGREEPVKFTAAALIGTKKHVNGNDPQRWDKIQDSLIRLVKSKSLASRIMMARLPARSFEKPKKGFLDDSRKLAVRYSKQVR